MENNNSEQSILEFIQLIKCIIEYYGTTKTEEEPNKEIDNSIEAQLDEATKLLSSIDGFSLDGMTVKIPGEIDRAVKNSFLNQLKKFEEYSEFINK